MRNLLKRFINSNDGATAIEYALIASFIGAVIIASVTSVGTVLDGIFVSVNAGLN